MGNGHVPLQLASTLSMAFMSLLFISVSIAESKISKILFGTGSLHMPFSANIPSKIGMILVKAG